MHNIHTNIPIYTIHIYVHKHAQTRTHTQTQAHTHARMHTHSHMVTIAVIKHHDEKQLEERRLFWCILSYYCLPLRSGHKFNQAGTQRGAAYRLASHGLPSLLSYET